MNIDSLNKDTLHKYVPNVLSVAEGEPTLYEKLQPYIESSKLQLETDYLTADDFLSEQHNAFAIKILVADALANAVPSLDLIITPTGLGVVNTDNLAPASKERVERLIQSLRAFVKTNLALLIDICRTYEAWRNSERGQWFGSSLMSSLSDLDGLGDLEYKDLRMLSMQIECKLHDYYIGPALLNRLRSDHNEGISNELIDTLRNEVRCLIGAIINKEPISENRLWQASRRVISTLVYFPEYKQVFDEDPIRYDPGSGFVNDVKGGYFF